jgi:hypothetical protein
VPGKKTNLIFIINESPLSSLSKKISLISLNTKKRYVITGVNIPNHLKNTFKVIMIQKKNTRPKPITIYNYRFLQEWVFLELAKGHKVVLFTNDEKIYKNLKTKNYEPRKSFFTTHDFTRRRLGSLTY